MKRSNGRRRAAAAALSVLFALPNAANKAAAADFSNSAAGTSTAQFLELGVGARGEAMGGAYSAVADGVDALYWNPAGLSAVSGSDVTVMHAPYIASSFYDFAGYAQKAGPGTLALGLQYFSAGSVAATDASGASIGSVTPNDLAVSVGYGYRFEDGPLSGFGVGASAKYIQSTLATTAQTQALDLGLLSPRLFDNKLELATTVTNLGGTMKFDSVPENLPLAVRLGSSYHLAPDWLAALDLIFPRDNGPQWDAGMEYRFAATEAVGLAGRIGYSSISDGISGFTGFTMGLGFSLQQFVLDYGFVPYGDLGLTHRISLTYHFKTPQTRPTPVAPPPSPPAPRPVPAPTVTLLTRIDDSLQGHLEAGQQYEDLGEPGLAVEQYRDALRLLPTNPEILLDLARALIAAADLEGARAELLKADHLLDADDPRHVYTQERLGEVDFRESQPQAAKPLYLGALKFAKDHYLADSNVLNAYIGLARCLVGEGQKGDAIRNYQKALTLAGDDAARSRIAGFITALGGKPVFPPDPGPDDSPGQ